MDRPPAVTKTTSYTYNLAGDLATLTYPSARMITYTYDLAGRPSTAKDVANVINYVIGSCNGGACYAPQGALSQVQNGSNLVSTNIYNTRLQPCWLYATTGTALATNTSCTATDSTPGNILDLQYNFNLGTTDNGNVMGITNNRDTTRTQTFTYDQVNRIITAASSTFAASSSHCWGETYTYDQWANMYAIGVLSSAYNGCTQDSLSVLATTSNQLSATGLSYNFAGNMVTDGVNTYGYNAENEIKSAAGVNYTYDGDGNRLQKSSGKIYWYGAGTEILDESDASGNFTNEYVFFGGKRVAMRVVSTNVIEYYAEDMLGSSRTVVPAGHMTLCYDADFLPFGKELTVTNTCTQTYKFEGKERDTETGNDDFGARYFSSRLGRWLSADWSSIPAPVPYANLSNPQTLNLYAMVSDNPETFADLDGHVAGTSATVPQEPTTCGGKLPACPAGSDAPDPSGEQVKKLQEKTQIAQTAQPAQNTANNEPVLIAQNQTPNPQPDQQNKPQPNVPQEIKDIHSAYDKKVAEMTKNGERIGNGPANNFVSSLQRIGEALGLTHHHLCSCNEQAEKISNSLNVSMKDTSYSFGLKQSWTHSWVEGRSSVQGAPVLTLDPWKNKFEVQQ